MKPKLVVTGAAGRMGKRVLNAAVESGEFEIAAATEADGNPTLGKDAGLTAGIGELGVPITTEGPADADVVIDFSLPQATDKVIDYCVQNNVALILATTGLSDEQLKKVDEVSAKIPIIQQTNMSVGMNTLFAVVGKVANMLGEEYDIEITEAHHRFKRDAPSGSAMTLAENVAKETGRDFPDCLVHGRYGKEAVREKGTIGMHAIRGGDITGEHSVIYSSLGETITISHSAHNRDNFARGSVRAAKWLAGKPAGRYSMADALGIK
ncbi:4-hydroxy-tetrahydrodipicolinate reductase [Anaerohalosphaera lusitana]|uniref:4-hydroxy-tetrahydrodipicolinate reductase n=1 Tax=Anaerohalosphaera lusitana TaxID=1936003 RepID=A0A1U9NNY3_9BACT|nr:4-hydroxy-tetrahydrodipicolinate reductase [Anaerohalosphaera lusitana]AQT69555.1 4-hydroxy-tetrahydrodipicolinate reductase [Anaerohalosphaera lusitana]